MPKASKAESSAQRAKKEESAAEKKQRVAIPWTPEQNLILLDESFAILHANCAAISKHPGLKGRSVGIKLKQIHQRLRKTQDGF